MTFEIEVMRKVFDNELGLCINVGPDADGLGIVEIDGGQEYGRICLPPQHALYLAKAIIDCAVEMGAPHLDKFV